MASQRRYSSHDWRCEFKIGSRLDALDLQQKWFVGVVMDVRPNEILVHFESWSSKYDTWYSTDSETIAPLGTHTQYAKDDNKTGVPRYFKEDNESITVREIFPKLVDVPKRVPPPPPSASHVQVIPERSTSSRPREPEAEFELSVRALTPRPGRSTPIVLDDDTDSDFDSLTPLRLTRT